MAEKRNITIKASVTVEAALTIPLFFFAVLSLVYLLEVQSIRFSIRSAAQSAGKTAAENVVLFPVLNIVKMERDMVGLIGPDRMDRSIMVGGSGGLNLSKTRKSALSGEIDMVIDYAVRLPFPRFTNLTARFREELKIKGWTGYTRGTGGKEEEEIVYISDTGLVYHKDYQCTYLQLSIRFVASDEIGTIRNESGGIYRRCEKCVHGDTMAGVYVTDTGGKYHNSLQCSGLKRTIYAVKKSEVGIRGGCSRCTE